jgi:sugar/nucleoside kinase (ribokinase family)
MRERFDCVVAGEIFADQIMSGFDYWPAPGKEAFAKEYHREIGGGAVITACGLAKLGCRAAVLGIVGSDGEWVLEQLRRNSVDTAEIEIDPDEPTGFTVAVTGPDDRAFLTYGGANRDFPPLLAEAAAGGRLACARHVHLACSPDLGSAADLMDAIRAAGCTISLDVGWHEDWLTDPRAPDALRLVDLFFPNELEARAITRRRDPEGALRAFRRMGLRRVALKLGARGAALLWDGEMIFAPGTVVAAVDTTGAGDCFDAGFLHAWLNGAPPRRCLEAANVCGALSTEKPGGIAGFPDPERLRRELEGEPCER